LVLWAHDDWSPPIGRGVNVRTENGVLKSAVEFAPRDAYPLADTVYQLIKGKFINAASVGFVPIKYQFVEGPDRPWGIDFIEQELLEWSVVSIPANPDCLVGARSLGIDCKPLLAWAERVLDLCRAERDLVVMPRSSKRCGVPPAHRSNFAAPWCRPRRRRRPTRSRPTSRRSRPCSLGACSRSMSSAIAPSRLPARSYCAAPRQPPVAGRSLREQLKCVYYICMFHGNSWSSSPPCQGLRRPAKG
jgi:HK97 family phage prohead protease